MIILAISNKSNRFRRVVLVEYPREGLYSVGFVTGDVGPSLQPELEEKLFSVFLVVMNIVMFMVMSKIVFFTCIPRDPILLQKTMNFCEKFFSQE